MATGEWQTVWSSSVSSLITVIMIQSESGLRCTVVAKHWAVVSKMSDCYNTNKFLTYLQLFILASDILFICLEFRPLWKSNFIFSSYVMACFSVLQLAEVLEKVRQDYSILIWDVLAGPGSEVPHADKKVSSSSVETLYSPRPIVELCEFFVDKMILVLNLKVTLLKTVY